MTTATLRPRMRQHAQWIAVLAAVAAVAFVAVGSYAAGAEPTAAPKVVAVAGNRGAIVHWQAAHASPRPVTHCRVIAYIGGAVKARKTVGRVTQTTIGGLTNGKRYTFKVNAVNANGLGPARTSHAVTVGAPAQPTHV